MILKSNCPHCEIPIEYSMADSGQTVDCPNCKAQIILTGLDAPPLTKQPSPMPNPPQKPNPNLKKCKDCGHQVSKRAEKCPHCGAKIAQTIGVLGGCFVITIAFFIIAAIGGAFIPDATNFPQSAGRAPSVKIFITSSHLTIQNNEKTEWSGGTVYINGQPPFTYRYGLPTIKTGKSISIPLNEFIKKNGARFNPYMHKVVEVWVGGGGYDYGSFAN